MMEPQTEMNHPYMRYGGGAHPTKMHDFSIKVDGLPPFLQYCEDKARFARTRDGTELFYELHGRGDKKCVFVMGLGGTHCEWEDQVAPLLARDGYAEEYTMMVFDNRGIGFSDTPGGRWTTSAMAGDVLDLLDHAADIDGPGWRSDVHLIGTSMGGMISLEAALTQPARFASLTLISSHAGGVGALPPMNGLKTLVRTFLSSQNEVDIINAALELKYPVSVLDAPSSKTVSSSKKALDECKFWVESEWDLLPRKREQLGLKILRRMRKLGEKVGALEFNVPGLIKQVGAVITHYISHQRLAHLKHCELPILIMYGDSDIVVRTDNSRAMVDWLGADELQVSNAGHAVNEQCPEEVNAKIVAHFAAAEKKNAFLATRRRPFPAESNRHPYVRLLAIGAAVVLLRRIGAFKLPAKFAAALALVYTIKMYI